MPSGRLPFAFRMPGKALHHVELCVGDGSSVLAYLTDRFGFKVTAERETEACCQKVVAAGECVFVVTERMKTSASSSTAPFETFCCTSNHVVDSVFNVALEVRDVDRATSRFVEAGARLLVAPTVAADSDGQVRYAVVRSCCGNIVHTLLDKSGYCGPFLPTFRKVIGDNLDKETERITHIDHLTYVCHPGDSKKIIDWYGQCLGTKPFRASIEEDPIEGLVIGGGIGMRLRVMDYWRCAETGVYLPECERGEEASSLKIVLAETLPGQGNTHIQAFLDGHGGPGLQHIGFHTKSINSCVRNLAGKGVPFRKAPSAYYQLVCPKVLTNSHSFWIDC